MSVDTTSALGDELVTVDLARSEAMRRLFAQVFGHEMTSEHWRWKYLQEQGSAVGLLRGADMIAHYGGVTRRVLHRSQPVLACQVCDVMVTRSANAALVRKGPLYKVAARFLDAEVGFGRRHLLAFGFPSARHHAVAKRLGLYGDVDKIVSLAWPAAADAATPGLSMQSIGAIGAGFDVGEARIVDRLWRRMASSMPEAIVGVRDAAWLRYRYLMHPGSRYDVCLVRQGWLRRPLGLMVLRTRDAHLDLLDLVAEPAAFPVLVAAARMRARELGKLRVEAWVTESQHGRLMAAGDRSTSFTDLQIPLPHITHTNGPSADEQRGRWWLMGGDADFT